MSVRELRLNSDQRRAVEHPAGPLLVLAGPGTGKTGVLIARIVHLVEERGVKPSRILALTFSRRASEEMEDRLKRAFGDAANVEVRTFHSFALKVVKRNYAALGLSAPPGIIPTSRQWQLVREILAAEDPSDWGLSSDALSSRATVKEIYDLLLRARENSLSPEALTELGQRHGLKHLERAGYVLREYDERLKRASEVDYEQVVQQTIRLLKDGHEEVSGRYDHVLVDEFQDTNRSQLDLVRLLAPGEKPNVFCVGDDAQSIYGFRGARARNVREFETYFPGAAEVQLRANYRSAQPVVSLAEAALNVEEIAREREPQTLPEPKEGSVLRQVRATEREEGEWISDRILELSARGVPFEEIAVLRRSLLDSETLIEALRSRGIPVDFSNTPARTSAGRLAILFLASEGEDPNPKQASRAAISPLVGMSSEAARSLRDSAQSSSLSVFQMVRDGVFPEAVPEADRALATATVEVVDAAHEEPDFLKKLDVLRKRLPGAKALFDAHARDADAARAIADTGAFVRAAKSYARATANPTVTGFLAAGDPLDEDSDTWAPTSPPVEGAVRVMTVHASKGLEFEAVFVSGLSREKFPVRNRGVRFVDTGLLAGGGRTSAQELEARHLREERRLFYVAITRAKTYLFLTGVEEPSEEGAKPSEFLTELEPYLATLMSRRSARRFWASREEAVEELRRLALDPSSEEADRFAACRALAEMDERPDGPTRPWWSHVGKSSEEPASPPPPELREGQLTDLASCPRRAFLAGLVGRSGGRRPSGGMSFGATFSDAFEVFLTGDRKSFREVMREVIEEGEFGGPAFREHWMREISTLDPVCDEWARGIRENLASEGDTWTVEIAGRKVTGRHGPVTESDGTRVMNRITTSKNAMSIPDAEKDISLSLKSLGADADRAELHHPRKLAYGRPTLRVQGSSEGWREEFLEVMRDLFEKLENGEYPPNPDDGPCDRCAFRTVCAAHRADESWLDTGAAGRDGV